MNSIKNIINPIANGFRRYHLSIFIVTLACGLAVAIILLNGIVLKASISSGSAQNSAQSVFDQTTIDRIKQLKASTEPSTPLDFSQSRISPFAE